MKNLIYLLLLTFGSITCHGQIINGNFENDSNPDLFAWDWTCNASSFNDASPEGGSWCIQVNGGNTQGCFPGYAFQRIPSIENGQAFVLSAWAYAQSSAPVGIYFGRINNGIIELQAGDTTSFTSWTALSVQSNFSLSTGDTAVVVLNGGFTGGPVQGYGYFDLVSLEQVAGLNAFEKDNNLLIMTNPFSTHTTILSKDELMNAQLILYNVHGQKVKQIQNVSGKEFVLQRDNFFAGIYFMEIIQSGILKYSGKVIIVD